jgi:hypothetical protein
VPTGALAALRQIGRVIAQNNVLLAEAQVGEKVFDVGDAFEHAEHDDDVAMGGGLGRKVAARDIAGGPAVAGDAVTALIAAAVRKQRLQRRFRTEIEHARAGRDELGGELRPRVDGKARARRQVGRGIERQIEIEVQGHCRRAEPRCRTQHKPANQQS